MREFGPSDYNANYYGHDGPSLTSNYSRPYNELNFRKALWLSLTAQHIISELKLNGGVNTVLDIGGATGLVASFIKLPRTKLINVDLSTWATSNTVKTMERSTLQGNLRNLPFAGNNFDGIICLDVLEHIIADQVPTALSEIRRVMRPKSRGILVINLGEGEDFKKDLSHVNLHEKEWWSKHLKEQGFALDESISVTVARAVSSFNQVKKRIYTAKSGLFIVSK